MNTGYLAEWIVEQSGEDPADVRFESAVYLQRWAAEEKAKTEAKKGPCPDWWTTEKVEQRRYESNRPGSRWVAVDGTRWVEGVSE